MTGKYTAEEIDKVISDTLTEPVQMDRRILQSAEFLVEAIKDYAYRTLNSDIDSVYYLMRLTAEREITRCSQAIGYLEELIRLYNVVRLDVSSPDAGALEEMKNKVEGIIDSGRTAATDEELSALKNLLEQYNNSTKTASGQIHSGVSPETARERSQELVRKILRLAGKIQGSAENFYGTILSYMSSGFESVSMSAQSKKALLSLSSSDGTSFENSKDAALKAAVALSLLNVANTTKKDITRPKYEGPVETLPGEAADLRGDTVPLILQDRETAKFKVDGDDDKVFALTAPASKRPFQNHTHPTEDWFRTEEAELLNINIVNEWAPFGASSFNPNLIFPGADCYYATLPWLKTTGVGFFITGEIRVRPPGGNWFPCQGNDTYTWLLPGCKFDGRYWSTELKLSRKLPLVLFGHPSGVIINMLTLQLAGTWEPRTGMIFIRNDWGFWTVNNPNPNAPPPPQGGPPCGVDFWWVSPDGPVNIMYIHSMVSHGVSFNTPPGHPSTTPIVHQDYRRSTFIDHNSYREDRINKTYIDPLSAALATTSTVVLFPEDLVEEYNSNTDLGGNKHRIKFSGLGFDAPASWVGQFSWSGHRAQCGSAFRLAYPPLTPEGKALYNNIPFQPKFTGLVNAPGKPVKSVNQVLDLSHETRGEKFGRDTDFSGIIITPPEAEEWVDFSVDTKLPVAFTETRTVRSKTPESEISHVDYVDDDEDIIQEDDDLGVETHYVCHTKVVGMASELRVFPPLAIPVEKMTEHDPPIEEEGEYNANITRNELVLSSSNDGAESSIEVLVEGFGFTGNSQGSSNVISLVLPAVLTGVVTDPGYNIKPRDVILEKTLAAIRPIGVVKAIEGSVVTLEIVPEGVPHDYPFKSIRIVALGWQRYEEVREGLLKSYLALQQAIVSTDFERVANTYVTSGSGATRYLGVVNTFRDTIAEIRKSYLNYDAHVVNTVSMLLQYLKQEKLTLPLSYLMDGDYERLVDMDPEAVSEKSGLEQALEGMGETFNMGTGEPDELYHTSGDENSYGIVSDRTDADGNISES